MSRHDPPSDSLARRYPVSIKGVLEVGGGIVLLRNERDEWELPGGKLEANESPEQCLEREMLEELNVRATATRPLHVWVYDILGRVDVLVVAFATRLIGSDAALRPSHEHRELAVFRPEAIATLNMPSGYMDAIARYYADKEQRRP